MPWCATCRRYLTTPSLERQACPSCGQDVQHELDDTRSTLKSHVKVEGSGAGGEVGKVPWHFWVVLAAVGGYLAWRVIQAAIWVLERL